MLRRQTCSVLRTAISHNEGYHPHRKLFQGDSMLILLIILLLLFGGGGGYYGYSRWGTGGGLGVVGTVVVIALVLYFVGVIH